MIRLLGGIAISALLAAPAFAADMPVKAAPAPAAAVFSWTGCYIGVQWGIGVLKSDNSFQTLPGGGAFIPEENTNGSGGLAGGHLGCNYQTGQWVFGIEGDGEWTGMKGNDAQVGGDINELRARWMASARGRLGFAVQNVLLYATGGVAWMGAESNVLNPTTETTRKTISGWTVGGGFEYSFWQNFSGRFEYRYANFGTEDFALPINGYTERHHDIHVHTFRGALTYRFNFGGPVVARY